MTGARGERWLWRLALVVFTVLLAARSLPFVEQAVVFPSYEETVVGNFAGDVLAGRLVTGPLAYAYSPATSLTLGVLAVPLFALGGPLHIWLMALTLILSLASWLLLVGLVRRAEPHFAWALLPALLLMPDALAYAQIHPSAPHREQFFFYALALVFLAAFVAKPARRWAAALFGLALGVVTFNWLANLVTVAVFALVAAMLLDKRRLLRLTVWAAPVFAAVASLRLGLDRTAYGFSLGSPLDAPARLWDALTGALPAIFDFGEVTRDSAIGAGMFLFIWAALTFLRRRDLAVAVCNLFRREAEPLPPTAVLDLFLILFVPAWLLGVSLHAWGATPANWRYLTPLACVLLLAPGRLRPRGSGWLILAPLVTLLAIQINFINYWPTLEPFTNPDRRAVLLASAAGNRGTYYPLYLKRAVAPRLLDAAPTDRAALLARLDAPWRTWAVREAASLAALEDRAPLDPTGLTPGERAALAEGIGQGAVARMGLLRNADPGPLFVLAARQLNSPTLPAPADASALYHGIGAQMMSTLTGLGGPAAIDAWAEFDHADPPFRDRLARLKGLAAALPNAAEPLFFGLGLAAGARPPSSAVPGRLAAELFPDHHAAALLNAYFRGVGAGQARFRFARSVSWVNGENRLCLRVPDPPHDACVAGFQAETAALGFTLAETVFHDFRRFAFAPLGRAAP
jgi:hypothetical protein